MKFDSKTVFKAAFVLRQLDKENDKMKNLSALAKNNVQSSTIIKYLLCSIAILLTLAINDIVLVAQEGSISTNDKKSMDIAAAARRSLGGQKIDSINSIILTGNLKSGIFSTLESTGKTTRTGETLCEFEIKILFPDNFVQTTRCTSNDAVSYYGIINEEVFSISTTLDGELKNHSIRDASLALDGWNRLSAGMIMKSFSTSLILSANSNDDFIIERDGILLGTMVFDVKDNWPARIDYKATVQSPEFSRNKDGAMIPAGTKIVESPSYVQFSDRVSVDGLMFPKTIRQVIPDRTDLTMTINDIKINSKLSIADFDIPAKFAE